MSDSSNGNLVKLIQKTASTLRSVLARSLFICGGLLILTQIVAKAAQAEQQTEAALMPFLDVLASPPAGAARAFRIQGRLESLGARQFPAEQMPAFDFAVQPPMRMRLSFPLGDTQITACRNAQHAWAAPEVALKPVLDFLRPSANRKVFQPIALPFSGKQLALLPVLLEVQDKGSSPLEGSACRVVDVRMQPALNQLLPQEAQRWALRLWLNTAGNPVRAGVTSPAGSAVVRVDQVEFSPELPSSLWATAENAKVLSPEDFEQIAEQLMKAVPVR
jgi:hypothetical protein